MGRLFLVLLAGWFLGTEACWASCSSTTYAPKSKRKQRKIEAEHQRIRARRAYLGGNAGLLRINLIADKAVYLPYEVPTFTVTISNPHDRALEVPEPFHPMATEFARVTQSSENCGGESFDIPPASVLVPFESVTRQMAGRPEYGTFSSIVQYGFSFMGNLVFAEIRFAETAIRSRVAIRLATPLRSIDERGNQRETPREATVFTVEAGDRHFIAMDLHSHPTQFIVGLQLSRGEFERIKFVQEEAQPIQILAVTENPHNLLCIDYKVGTETKQLQIRLSDATSHILSE